MPKHLVSTASWIFWGFFSLPLWSAAVARNLFNIAASRPISNAKVKVGRAVELGSPSPVPASIAYMSMPATVALP